MLETIIKHKFNYLDKVKHLTEGSPIGIVLDISWSFQSKRIKYLVAFGMSSQDWYYEDELETAK